VSGFVSKKDFAAILGCSKPYVSQLVAARRLVLSDDGKRVDVDRSLELLGATADPSKAGVRERWAAFRAAQQQPAPQPAPAAAPAPAVSAPPAAAPAEGQEAQPSLLDETPAAAAAPTPARSEYQDARTRRERADAEMAEIELMKARGRVLEASGTLRAVEDAHIQVRTELLGLADRLTPLVAAETNARKVWELIHAECELLCTRMHASAARLSHLVEVSA
jgi:hypothetical protein